MKPINRDMERTLIQPERMSLPDRSWLEAGRAREFMDKEMQHGDVLRHASTVLARNLRERHFVGMIPNPVIPPRGELPQTHVKSVVLLTYHLYHLTPLLEYCLKHPHVWTRSPLFGSFIHIPYTYVHHMLSYGPTGLQLDFICIHRPFI